MKGEAYWFYLEPYVYATVKRNNHVLLYNTHNGQSLEYIDQPVITGLVKRIVALDNLYVLNITETMLSRPVVAGFVRDVREQFMGDLLNIRDFPQKPVQMMPYLNVEKDVAKFKIDAPDRVGEDLMTYVSEISFYLTNQCRQDCHGCRRAFLQFPYCTRSPGSKVFHLPLPVFKNVLQETAGTSLFRLSFLGGDVLLYPDLEELLLYLDGIKSLKSFYFHYQNITGSSSESRILRHIGDNGEIIVLVDFPVNERPLARLIEQLSVLGLEAAFFFPVKSEREVEEAGEIDLESLIHNRRLLPYFDGSNLDFFERNVFLSKEIILGAKPSFREIFARQAINGNNFGKLTIFPDGRIYSNVNMPRLGNIKRHSLYEAVYKEMLHGRGWRLTRRNVNPCKRCVYDSLCPPLSNYELVMGRNNLCDVWEE